MSVCCCSLAGTAACRTCLNNPDADRPPVVRTNTVAVFDPILITRNKTNADRIRAMTDEELADFITRQRFSSVNAVADKLGIDVSPMFLIGCKNTLNWLKQDAERNEEKNDE